MLYNIHGLYLKTRIKIKFNSVYHIVNNSSITKIAILIGLIHDKRLNNNNNDNKIEFIDNQNNNNNDNHNDNNDNNNDNHNDNNDNNNDIQEVVQESIN